MNDKNHEKRSNDFPSHGKIGDCILAHLHRGRRPVDVRALYKRIADELRLTKEQRRAKRGTEPAWHYHVRQAKQHLVDAGLIQKTRGPCSLTMKGHTMMQCRDEAVTE